MCICVCYLALVFYQDQTAAPALATEDSALLSALVGMIILPIPHVESRGSPCSRKKLLRQGIWGKDFTHVCITQHIRRHRMSYEPFSQSKSNWETNGHLTISHPTLCEPVHVQNFLFCFCYTFYHYYCAVLIDVFILPEASLTVLKSAL